MHEIISHIWPCAGGRGITGRTPRNRTPWLGLFTPLELMWDCAALLRSECDANPASNTFREIELGGIWRDMRSLAHMSDHSTNEQWSDIIEAYSRRLLTKEEDKLPALSGIAQDYHKRFSRVRKICRGPLGVRNP